MPPLSGRPAGRARTPVTIPGDQAEGAGERFAHLAGDELHGGRHICGFFRDRDEAYGTLLPFVAEGITAGERVVQVVAAARRDSHLSMLRDRGVDVEGALASGQMKVEVWEDTYLRGGRFDQTATLALILGILSEARSAGYPRTRFVADMEWALRSPTGVQEVVDYEARAERALRKFPDLVICAYDAQRFGAPLIVDILAAHSWALVDGALKSTRSGQRRAAARDRILRAADRLFHTQGVQATSVDAVIAAADVAKATLYRHFPTKEGLIVGWLLDVRPRWFEGVRAVAEARAGVDPRVIPSLIFDAVAEWLVADDFRGCPYLNTSAEIADPAHRAHAVIVEYLDDIRNQLRSIVDTAGKPDAANVADQLQVLVAGAISLAVSRRTTEPVTTARDAAVRLLDGAGAHR